MATHSSILAWKIPWTEEPGGVHGVAESETTKQLSLFFFFHLMEGRCAVEYQASSVRMCSKALIKGTEAFHGCHGYHLSFLLSQSTSPCDGACLHSSLNLPAI